LALPPAWAGSVDNPAIVRAAHPREIYLLPQIENAAGRRLSRVALQLADENKDGETKPSL
jgi:hypothetical protein